MTAVVRVFRLPWVRIEYQCISQDQSLQQESVRKEQSEGTKFKGLMEAVGVRRWEGKRVPATPTTVIGEDRPSLYEVGSHPTQVLILLS